MTSSSTVMLWRSQMVQAGLKVFGHLNRHAFRTSWETPREVFCRSRKTCAWLPRRRSSLVRLLRTTLKLLLGVKTSDADDLSSGGFEGEGRLYCRTVVDLDLFDRPSMGTISDRGSATALPDLLPTPGLSPCVGPVDRGEQR
ncbi:hypothetical protein [Streptomyces sp. NPDC056669]|uniref:hypothetical protein n=1 Tax=unclassified Streptomyces TaxID=2593676 RepID=UPI0036BA18FC